MYRGIFTTTYGLPGGVFRQISSTGGGGIPAIFGTNARPMLLDYYRREIKVPTWFEVSLPLKQRIVKADRAERIIRKLEARRDTYSRALAQLSSPYIQDLRSGPIRRIYEIRQKVSTATNRNKKRISKIEKVFYEELKQITTMYDEEIAIAMLLIH